MKRRLLVTYLSLTAIILLLLQVPLGYGYAHTEMSQLIANSKYLATGLASVTHEPLLANDLDELQEIGERFHMSSGNDVGMFDVEGELIASAPATLPADRPEWTLDDHPDVVSVLERGEPLDLTSFERSPGSISVAVPILHGNELLGAIDVVTSTEELDRRVRIVWLVLAFFALFMLALAAIIGAGLASWAFRPLLYLHDAAMAWAHGRLDARVDLEKGPEELRELADSLDVMADRLERLVTAQQGFAADASHQLRAPLGAFRLRLENLEPSISPEARAEHAALLESLDGFARRLDVLLLLARAEAQSTVLEPVDLQAVAHERVRLFAPVAAPRGVRVVTGADLSSDGLALEFPGAVEQIIDNLLTNAVNASPPGGTVTVWLERLPSGLALHVTDEGPGMSPEEREAAFGRFWQMPGGSKGSGLGLAIVARLASAMGARVRLDAAPGGGVDAVLVCQALQEQPFEEPDPAMVG